MDDQDCDSGLDNLEIDEAPKTVTIESGNFTVLVQLVGLKDGNRRGRRVERRRRTASLPVAASIVRWCSRRKYLSLEEWSSQEREGHHTERFSVSTSQRWTLEYPHRE